MATLPAHGPTPHGPPRDPLDGGKATASLVCVCEVCAFVGSMWLSVYLCVRCKHCVQCAYFCVKCKHRMQRVYLCAVCAHMCLCGGARPCSQEVNGPTQRSPVLGGR